MTHLRDRQLPVLSTLVVVALLLSFSTGPRAAAAPDAPVRFRCEPAAYFGRTNELAVIDLVAEDAAGLYGLDVQLSFDPAIGHVVDADPAAPGAQIQPLSTWFVPGFSPKNYACNAVGPGDCATGGQLRFAATQYYPQPPIPPANSSGPFARITFMPQAEGAFTLNFTYHVVSDIDGFEIPSTSQGCPIEFLSPTAVRLVDPQAVRAGESVRLTWATASEQSIVGFNIYRSVAAAGPWLRLNAAPVLARSAGAGAGNGYAWTDDALADGPAGWYLIEEISPAGVLTRHPPVQAQSAAAVDAPAAVRLSGLAARPAAPALILMLVALTGFALSAVLKRR